MAARPRVLPVNVEPAGAPAQRWRRWWLAPALLGAAVLAAYAPSLTGAFVFDDESTVIDNPSIRQLWPLSTVLAPPPEAGICGRPLANLTMALNYAAHGLAPGGYHGVNVLLHLIAGALLFGLTRRTLTLLSLRERFAARAHAVAFAATALWLLHPVQTNAVAYVSQRVEVLMAVCYLLTLYGLVRTATSPGRGWPVLTVVACAAGMASKEVMVTAPVVAFLYDRTFLSGSFRSAWQHRRGLHLALASTWLLLAWLMSQAQLAERGIGYALGVSSFEYALTSSRTLWLYLRLALWPAPLVFDYGWTFLRTVPEALPYLLPALLAVAAGIVALWRWPKAGFLVAAFLGILAPTTSVVPIIQQPVAESRLYLPLAAVTVAAAVLLPARLGRAGLVAALGLAALGAGATFVRTFDYRTPLALWSDTVAKRPDNARAHNNLGSAWRSAGALQTAAVHFAAAVRLQPAYPEPHHNLGLVALEQGQPADAVRHLSTALQLRPGFFSAHYNLAQAWLTAGDAAAAETHLRHALAVRPSDSATLNNLSVVLLQQDRVEEALTAARAAIAADPSRPEAHYNCGNALLRGREPRAAIACYERALELGDSSAALQNNLGVALLHDRQPAAAAVHFARAIAIDPTHRDAARNLAVARAAQ